MKRRLNCSCGGRLVSATLDGVPLEPLFGLKGTVVGPLPGFRCDRCEETTFDGVVFQGLLFVVARFVLSQGRILRGEEARFLRKAVLASTQEQLAERMGIHKITIVDWERGERPLSKEHDYELRGISLATLLKRAPAAQRRGLLAVAESILAAPRTAPPPKRNVRHAIPATEAA